MHARITSVIRFGWNDLKDHLNKDRELMVASNLHFEVHKQHIENKTPENKASSSVEQLYPGSDEQVQ